MDDKKKSKTFLKNLFVMASAFVIIISALYLFRTPWAVAVIAITYGIAFCALVVLLEDAWRKITDEGEKLSWQYFVGVVMVIGSIVAFLWASESKENLDMILRLSLAVFLGGLGGFWFHGPYARSLCDGEELEQQKWKRVQKKLDKAKTADTARAIIYKSLRYRLVGDNCNNSLNSGSPLAEYQDKFLTYNELVSLEDESNDYQIAMRKASDYIELLMQRLTFETPEVIGVAE